MIFWLELIYDFSFSLSHKKLVGRLFLFSLHVYVPRHKNRKQQTNIKQSLDFYLIDLGKIKSRELCQTPLTSHQVPDAA